MITGCVTHIAPYERKERHYEPDNYANETVVEVMDHCGVMRAPAFSKMFARGVGISSPS